MVIPRKTFILPFIILALMTTEAHARLQTPLMEQSPPQQHRQTAKNTDTTVRLYQQLHHLLGDSLYTYLLESDDFLRLQDLTVNFIEKSYPVAHPRRYP